MLEAKFVKRLDAFPLEVDLKADRQAVALLGASGSGKSMTLKCIAGVEKPDEGRIVLDGQVLFDSSKRINLPPQQRHVGLLFQNYALFPTMTVWQNIRCGLRRLPRAEQNARIAALIARFHLEGLEKRLPAMLSGGQQQRVALARMLASEPRLLMLDEPFSALDSFLRWELEQTVAEVVAAHGGETLFVSHNRDEAYRLCDRVAVMENGRIEVNKPKNDLFRAPETQAGARLIGCENIAPAALTDGVLSIPAWGLRLAGVATPAYTVHAAGIPADALRLCEAPDACRAQVQRVIECPDDVLAVVLPAGGAQPLRCRLPKADGLRLAPGDRISLCADLQRIHLLR